MNRNRLIAEVILSNLKEQDVGLVISERVEHCHILMKMLVELRPSMKVLLLTGKTKLPEREASVAKANDGKVQLIIATRLADEGLDIPRLNRLFLVTPSRALAKVKQQLGRIMRIAADKKDAIAFDFVDHKVPLLHRQAKERSKLYRQLECNVDSLDRF
ncbi:DEAD/DEAH box helicase [Heliorestis convoluta]|uniref:Type III restriction protein res subunit n=1 Tax=Heliorestis convoluta TaxID=356322 RepID=A0A5Q2N260_9FIRM|nr:helicase-related protein [Heliorestis convoluta]QGG48907.1 Type III restriction protein res subunit [Heliorestis convoluta]